MDSDIVGIGAGTTAGVEDTPPLSVGGDDGAAPNAAPTMASVSLALRWAQHHRVRGLYSWPDVAKRTEIVYARMMEEEVISAQQQLLQISQRLGYVSGALYAFVLTLEFLLCRMLEIILPAAEMDRVPSLVGERTSEEF